MIDVFERTRRPPVRLTLAALALGAFVIGTAELLVVGILNVVAADLGVPVATAGLLVTSYALGISIGGPIATALTIRLARRTLVLGTLAAFVLGNLAAVVATDVGLLLVARVVTGSLHGLFVGLASVIAAAIVPAPQRGSAVSAVFGGIAVATVLGVPLGTLVSQAWGWRMAFLGVVVLGATALVSTLFLVPPVTAGRTGGLAVQARHALAPRVLAMLGVGLLLFGGQFTAFTFVAAYLEDVTGITGSAVSAFLLAFGAASAAGTLVGGRLADRAASATLVVANLVLIAAIGALLVFGASPWGAGVALAAWGLVGFGLAPALQLRVITLAGPGADLAATLGASAVNAGIAAGAVVGGLALNSGGPQAVVGLAVVICAVALPATFASRWLRLPGTAAGPSGARPPHSRRVDPANA